MNNWQSNLIHWFNQNKRAFPWRQNITPYKVWISEIMLQQTRASVVVNYFNKWMARFPNVISLAEASEEEVLKTWEGLGYYSRARNIHKGAQFIINNFQNTIPSNYEDLQLIKGLGPYTIGAILSFAFHKPAAAVDGNVARVMSRFFALEIDITKQKSLAYIRSIILDILPSNNSWEFNEALIELGATLCNKIPLCSNCPLKEECKAYKQNLTTILPIKSKMAKGIKLDRIVYVCIHKDEYLIQQEKPSQLMAGLIEFPYEDFDIKVESIESKRKKWIEKMDISYTSLQTLGKIKQFFTKYSVSLYPIILKINHKIEDSSLYHWKKLDELEKRAFSSGHKRIFDQLKELL
ncbi:MAG: A/G-specific adenine glycosylase [Chlamydia sp. 32-24]|nr:MAG: A/G-specific adenine glycosylase [Chlamydia sp. 32-24]